MNKAMVPFDISNMPPLVKLAEDVQKSQTPRLLKRNNQTVALLLPVAGPLKTKKRKKTNADYEAFKAAAGSWREVDTEALKEQIYADRQQTNTRAPVKL